MKIVDLWKYINRIINSILKLKKFQNNNYFRYNYVIRNIFSYQLLFGGIFLVESFYLIMKEIV